MKFQTFVNEKKSTVTVKAIDPMSEYLTEFCNFYKKVNSYPDMTVFDEFVETYGKQINKMVGIATCNTEAGDVFDFGFGSALAYERYLKVFESYRINMYKMILFKIDNIGAVAAERIAHCVNRRCDREDRIDVIASRID